MTLLRRLVGVAATTTLLATTPFGGRDHDQQRRRQHQRLLYGLHEDRLWPRRATPRLLQLPLTSFDNNFELHPMAAESWSQSEDGLTWTFKLRPGLVWSDGEPLTATDYVFALQRAATGGYDFAWYWGFAGGIAGAGTQ
ncbi:MAG: ABC transporter substrate-binding protein [Cypionkella sp.]|nr:ABC transporter substrate-binding protein [Cypionkella sp.]